MKTVLAKTIASYLGKNWLGLFRVKAEKERCQNLSGSAKCYRVSFNYSLKE